MQYPLLSLLFATLGVSYIVTTPVEGDDIVAIFDAGISEQDIRDRLKHSQLIIAEYDSELGRLFATDTTGNAASTLYSAGASFVVDARFASFCSPAHPPRVSRGS